MSDNLNALSSLMAAGNPLTQANNAIQMQTGYQNLAASQFALNQAKLQPAYAGLMAARLKGDAATWDDVNASLADSARLGANISGLTANVNAAMARGES